MSNYISYTDIINNIDDIKAGDIVYIGSDIRPLMISCKRNGETFSCDKLIESIQKKVGEKGTLIIPTFNWDFCKGIPFDYYKTPSSTGSLGTMALKRKDFARTQHALYSCAVWGKDKDRLCKMNYKCAFGADSIFGYMHGNHAKTLTLCIELHKCNTFVHYVEQQIGTYPYRYIKDFTGDYIDKYGNRTERTYSMNVRNLDLDVVMQNYKIEIILEKMGLIKRTIINDIVFLVEDMCKCYDVIADDIKNNNSLNVCSYIGQLGN